LAESGIIGTSIGMALAGLKPIAEFQFSGFAHVGFAQLEGHASRFRARTQGQRTLPMVLRMPYGGGVRALEHHSESREAYYGHTPGLKCVIPSGPRNARALMVAAMRDPDPVVFMEPKRSYRAFREEVPETEEIMEIGQPQIVQQGEGLVVVSWGAMMRPTLTAVEDFKEKHKIDVTLIDLLTINPINENPIIEQIKKTGRCVIVQEAPRTMSVGSELVARINDKAFDYLEAPVKRVAGFDVCTPYFGRENSYLPNPKRILSAMEDTLHWQ
jgi:pyruvate dehydrogenase E1 component beta subunit